VVDDALLPAFGAFAALLRPRLPAPWGDLFFFGALAFVIQTAVQVWIWSGLAFRPETLEPETARTLLDVASFWRPVLTAATIMMLGAIVAATLSRRDAALPRWVGFLAAAGLQVGSSSPVPCR
jgi:hypothetical protein